MRVAIAVLAAALVTACSPRTRQVDPAADERAIRDLAARWQEALLARDPVTQAGMFAPDGVSYHDGQEPLVGPPAILAWETNAATNHPKAEITSTTDRIEIAAAHDIAVNTAW
jgi:uncharacterized protein (TIGR02246 family)